MSNNVYRIVFALSAIIVLAVVVVPVAYAHTNQRPQANNFMDVDLQPGTVSVFDDDGNKCYIVSHLGDNAVAISCVKR